MSKNQTDIKQVLSKILNESVVFWLIFILAFSLYLFNINFSDLWSDEVYTKSMVDCTFSEMYLKFKNDLHPPLYFIGLKVFTYIFGLSAFTLRFFSVLGALSTLLIGFFVGKRVFGKWGAVYFSLMLVSLPMLAAYTHNARMYTWSAFSVTGVFLYSCLYLKGNKPNDLIFLFIFTLMAIYIHYYSLIAAFVANIFVLLSLIVERNKKWTRHLISMLVVVVLFLPWLSMFFVQFNRVQNAFWAPQVGFNSILSCLSIPFTEQYWNTGFSIALMIIVYALTAIVIFLSFLKTFAKFNRALFLSLAIFFGTLLIAVLISLISQSILYFRYVMAIVTMLAVPITILIIQIKSNLIKALILSTVLLLGIRVSVSSSYFSYGPYKQTIEYISDTYPNIKKILHISEITAAPMLEYSGNNKIEHYWLKAEMSNVDAFYKIHQYSAPDEFLKANELFCMVNFNNLELNKNNFDTTLSVSQLIKTDTVSDNKVEFGNAIVIYVLKYKGNK